MTIVDAFFKQAVVYHVRVTSPDVILDKTFDLFKDRFKFVIVSQEGGTDDTKLHQHILLGQDAPPNKATDIKMPLLSLYPDAKGNKGHSIARATKKKSLASYVLKDGNYLQKGFTKQFIEAAIKLSFNHEDWKKKYKQLSDQVNLKEITLTQYTNKLLTMKAQANQPIYLNHMKAHVISVGIKIGEVDAEQLTSNLMDSVYGRI